MIEPVAKLPAGAREAASTFLALIEVTRILAT
jgi:hypothetical protein